LASQQGRKSLCANNAQHCIQLWKIIDRKGIIRH
jgi:hypothetical protein